MTLAEAHAALDRILGHDASFCITLVAWHHPQLTAPTRITVAYTFFHPGVNWSCEALDLQTLVGRVREWQAGDSYRDWMVQRSKDAERQASRGRETLAAADRAAAPLTGEAGHAHP